MIDFFDILIWLKLPTVLNKSYYHLLNYIFCSTCNPVLIFCTSVHVKFVSNVVLFLFPELFSFVNVLQYAFILLSIRSVKRFLFFFFVYFSHQSIVWVLLCIFCDYLFVTWLEAVYLLRNSSFQLFFLSPHTQPTWISWLWLSIFAILKTCTSSYIISFCFSKQKTAVLCMTFLL